MWVSKQVWRHGIDLGALSVKGGESGGRTVDEVLAHVVNGSEVDEVIDEEGFRVRRLRARGRRLWVRS